MDDPALQEGILQFLPVKLEGMPLEMIYGREARLVKDSGRPWASR